MKPYLILLAVLILSCKPSTEKNTVAEEPQTTEPDTLSSQNGPVFETREDAALAQLQGVWVSTEDSKSYLKVTDEQLLMGYEGMEDASDTYALRIADQLTDGQPSNSDTQYLILTQEGDTMNYAIDKLTEDSLTLLYLPRGNFLSYTKTKN